MSHTAASFALALQLFGTVSRDLVILSLDLLSNVLSEGKELLSQSLKRRSNQLLS